MILKNKSKWILLKEACLMDDRFFQIFFKDQPECAQAVVNAIFSQLGYPLVNIRSVKVQETLNNLTAKEARLDALAIDESGKLINIEIQRLIDSSLLKRASFYSSILEASSLEKGGDYADMPESFVIFLLDGDLRKKGKAVYTVHRRFDDDYDLYEDGVHIVFVNGKYNNHDSIGNLAHDLYCSDPSQIRNTVLAKRFKFLKESEEGRAQMIGIEEKILAIGEAKGRIEGKAEGMKEGKEEKEKELLLKFLKEKVLSTKELAYFFDKTVEEILQQRNKFIEEGLLTAQ